MFYTEATDFEFLIQLADILVISVCLSLQDRYIEILKDYLKLGNNMNFY